MIFDHRLLERILAGERVEIALEELQIFLLTESIREQREVLRILREIQRDLHPPPPQQLTQFVHLTFSGANMPSTNAVTLNVGQTSTATAATFLKDGTSPSAGVVSNLVVTFSDPSATAVANPDGATLLVTGVAAGSASGSASLTVTDTDGAVSQWTVPFTVTVNGAPPPDQLTQSVALIFSDPS